VELPLVVPDVVPEVVPDVVPPVVPEVVPAEPELEFESRRPVTSILCPACFESSSLLPTRT